MGNLIQRLLRKEEPDPVTAEDFEYIDESGLHTLVKLIDGDINNQSHLHHLQKEWAEYIKLVPGMLDRYIRRQPSFTDFLDDLFDEYNTGRDSALTEEDIIRDHVDPKSNLYQQLYDAAPFRVPANTAYYSSKVNWQKRTHAIKSLLRELNAQRAIERPEEDKEAEKVARLRIPNFKEAYMAFLEYEQFPSVEEYSEAVLMNMLGERFGDFDAVELEPSLQSVKPDRKPARYHRKLAVKINERFENLLEKSGYDVQPDPLIVRTFLEHLARPASIIQYEMQKNK